MTAHTPTPRTELPEEPIKHHYVFDGYELALQSYARILRAAAESLQRELAEARRERDEARDINRAIPGLQAALRDGITMGDVRDLREALASRLIDAWCADKGNKIPWAKAVQIVAIVTRQTADECDRLLRMGDEDGTCEMCGRSDAALAAGEGKNG